MSSIKLTSSSMGTLQTCAENYRLRYIQNLEAINRPGFLHLGSAFHDSVEVFRKTKHCTKSDMLMAAGKSVDVLSGDDMCVLTVMVETYYFKYKGEAGGFAEVEWEFDHPLTNSPDGPAIAGKVDAICKAGDGHLIFETKTAGRVDGAYLDRLWHARQSLVYNWVLNELGWGVQGVLYDIVAKPTIKRLLATPVEKRKYVTDKDTGEQRLYSKQRERDETDAEFIGRLRAWYQAHPEALHRELIVYTQAQLEAIGQDIKNEVKRLEWHMHSGVWPRSLNSCHRFNRPCEFSPLCESGGNPLILGSHYRRKEKTHSELEGDTDND